MLFLVAVGLDRPPEIRGPAPYPPEWQWSRRSEPASGRYLPVLLTGAGLLGLLAASGSAGAQRRPEAATWILLTGGTILGWGFSLALLGLEPQGALPTLAARVQSRTYTSYYTVAVSPEAADPGAFLRGHAALLPALRDTAKHAATHPPGPVLFYRALIALCDSSPALTSALLGAQGPDGTRPPRAPNTEASKAAALLGGLLLMLFGAAACWPVASLAARLTGDALAGLRIGLLWLVVPGATVLVPQFDQALALPVAAAAALLAKAGAGERWRFPAAVAGLAGGLALLVSYGSAAFLAIAGLAALAGAAADRTAARLAVAAALTALVVAAGVIAATAALGHEPLAAARNALAIHHAAYTAARSYALWLLFNPLDLAVFLGVPVAVLALARGMEAARATLDGRAEAADRFTAVLALGLGLLWLSGATRGEVGRIWIPLMPLLLVAALARRGGGQASAGPSRSEAAALGLLLAATSLVLRLAWDL